MQRWRERDGGREEVGGREVIGCYNTMDKHCGIKIKVTDHFS